MTDNTATASTSPAEVQASEDPITPTSESAPLIAGSGDPVQPQVGPYHGMPHFWRSVIGWLLFSLVWSTSFTFKIVLPLLTNCRHSQYRCFRHTVSVLFFPKILTLFHANTLKDIRKFSSPSTQTMFPISVQPT